MPEKIDPDEWAKLIDSLPERLEKLLALEPYSYEHRPPADERGVYLFSRGDEHLYVGRTSVTARARAAGRLDARGFRHRYAEHVRDSSPPGSAPFAARLARKRANDDGYQQLPAQEDWWKQRTTNTADRDPVAHTLLEHFMAAKHEIREMECRALPLVDDVLGITSTLIEMYVHVQLSTPYNDFSTS